VSPQRGFAPESLGELSNFQVVANGSQHVCSHEVRLRWQRYADHWVKGADILERSVNRIQEVSLGHGKKITTVLDNKPTKSVGHFEENKFSVGCHQFFWIAVQS
jgi:hypothetical protein